jgi:hypothetical protein
MVFFANHPAIFRTFASQFSDVSYLKNKALWQLRTFQETVAEVF